MHRKLVYLVILGLIAISSSAEVCHPQNNCECVFESDGSGYSLKPLASQDSYLVAFANDHLKFFFNPCDDTKHLPDVKNITSNSCKDGYMLCAQEIVGNKTSSNSTFVVLGNSKNVGFSQNTDGEIFLKFGKSDGSNESTILLQCAPNAKESVLYSPNDVSVNDTNLILFSKYACVTNIHEKEHAGFFSTFFLLLFIFLLVYLIAGITYNYFFVGARGLELLPNYDFWCKVWTSIKLAFFYVKNGCRAIPSEDTYDAI